MLMSYSSDLSSYSNSSTLVNVHEQTYVFPRGISTMTTTTTKFGITSKDLIGELHRNTNGFSYNLTDIVILVAGDNGMIQSFPRRFFDPRRPKRKPTNEEMEEWLVQYDPLTPDDPKRVISHTYEVRLFGPFIRVPPC